ncbi:glycosyltransferase family 2 protein [Sphingobacterium chuzhouense]|uniref:Glycosyltransferase family 2 protein n=1 Tax=Sphingobacterium chuzhouense TaxID=1742264 RepID=A0ABR7XM46_9SPHI|nr:glycosyltransferase family 2 protein [Sphingobacterium chuzhouense]MBD1420245.1 glycosyltransferase family 2 protein [Sphingobacterium chuzhouense]
MTPIFSIIIPCYNQANFLGDTLASVLKQSFKNWECLIIDDGSPDNTAEIAKEWEKNDCRFKLYQKENGGLSSARNHGLSKAKGEYIQFLDADDCLNESKLTKCYNEHVKGVQLVVTSFEHIKNGKISPPFCTLRQEYLDFDNILLKWDGEFSIPIHCGSFSKNIIGNLTFNEGLKAGEDWIFWLNIFEKKPDVTFINESLVFYRLHEKSITKNIQVMIEHKTRAQLTIFDLLNEKYKRLFFERFSLEAITRREELFNIYRNREKRIKNRIKVFFKKLTR